LIVLIISVTSVDATKATRGKVEMSNPVDSYTYFVRDRGDVISQWIQRRLPPVLMCQGIPVETDDVELQSAPTLYIMH